MGYEETPVKKTKLNKKQVLDYGLGRVSTFAILWFVVKRHKLGLMGTWAVVATALFFVPSLPTMIISLF